ncbi:MAG: 7-cyano-7-deazaguanine synthase QueC [Alphaproteobacteria bacterium]|nr:7-cyano-7-deazaguanine synthase QueC [Alphaproteobacteria bacterium]
MSEMGNSAMVLFSGGQDSTTCLAWALDRFDRVETVGFDYGQRHANELIARPILISALRAMSDRWKDRLGADHVLPLDTLAAIGGSALLGSGSFAAGPNGLPGSFVPGRNVFFLAAAAALGYRRNIFDFVGGMCETDYSGYPDCREETIQSAARTLSLALEREIRVHSPLMRLDKAATWHLAQELGGNALVELILDETVTCYEGDRKLRHAWGYGCGACPACRIRARGYEAFRKS